MISMTIVESNASKEVMDIEDDVLTNDEDCLTWYESSSYQWPYQ